MLRNEQESLSLPASVSIFGKYSQNGGTWQPIDGDAERSALDGDLVLKGHFDNEIPEGMRLNFYLDHIGYSVYVNGAFYAMNTVMELSKMDLELTVMPSACGGQWEYWLSPGITQEDEIEIYLHNPHDHGNQNAYRNFLSTLCLTPDMSDVLNQKLEPYSRPFEVADWSIFIAAVMLLGVAIASVVMGVSVGGAFCKYHIRGWLLHFWYH